MPAIDGIFDKMSHIKRRDLINLLNRAAAELEAMDDKAGSTTIKDLIEDLTVAASQIEKENG